MANIARRGPEQYQARVRRNGRYVTRTFPTRSEAEDWAAVIEGKVIGDEFADRRLVKTTTLAAACGWYESTITGTTQEARNKRGQLNYWRRSEFADWSLASIRPANLLQWRRKVLDEDTDPDEAEPEVAPQTVVHRLNTLSQIYKRWSLAHDTDLTNPVVEGVRPPLPRGRDRRLNGRRDRNKQTEEDRLLEACAQSSRHWLKAAVIISLETCMRQAELAGLTWDRVHLRGEYPYCDLPYTKNDRARRVPLSKRAVEEFRALRPQSHINEGTNVFPVQTPRAFGHAWRDVVTDAKFPNLRWHDLRHEAISRLFERTDLRDNEIMAISGHLRAEMLTRYTHLRTDRLAARLPGGRENRLR